MQFMALPTGLEVTSWLKMTPTLQGVFADEKICLHVYCYVAS